MARWRSGPSPSRWPCRRSKRRRPAGTPKSPRARAPLVERALGGRADRRGRAQRFVPGAGEPALVALTGERPIATPLAARQLVVDLEAIAVGIREVESDRDRV